MVWKKKKKEHLVSGTAWEESKWNYTGSIQVTITANEQDEESVCFILSSNEELVYLLKVSKLVKERRKGNLLKSEEWI